MTPVGVNLSAPEESQAPDPVQVIVPASVIEAVGDSRYASKEHTHEYEDIEDKPTTLAGFGIETEVNDKLSANKEAPSNYSILEGVAFADAVASPVFGTLQSFTDSLTDVWGDVISGGGASQVLGFFNGTNWTVAAK